MSRTSARSTLCVLALLMLPATAFAQENNSADQSPLPPNDATVEQLLDFCRKHANEQSRQGESDKDWLQRICQSQKLVLKTAERILDNQPPPEIREAVIQLQFNTLQRLADPYVAKMIHKDPRKPLSEYRRQLRQFAERHSDSDIPNVRRWSLIGRAFALAPDEAESAKQIVRDVDRVFKSEDPSGENFAVARRVGWSLETLNDKSIAADAYTKWGKWFASSADRHLAQLGERLQAAGRFLKLPGNRIAVMGTTAEGNTFDWSKYRGKVVLIYFWFTNCSPCVAAMPDLTKLHEEYRSRGFDIVGINVDDKKENLEKFLAGNDLPWTTIYEGAQSSAAEAALTTRYGIDSYPTKILVDRNGIVVDVNTALEELPQKIATLTKVK